MRTSHLVASVAALALAAACNDSGKPPSGQPSALPNVVAPASSATATAKATATASTTASAAVPAPPALVPADPAVLPPMRGLASMDLPADNPITQDKIALGKALFFDTRLGKDAKYSCEGCHYEDKGWADGNALSKKADGNTNKRHTPTLFNVGYQKLWYWDGRAPSLEAQTLAAWKGQMGVADALDERVKAVGEVAGYKPLFKAAFGSDEVSSDRIVKALASFVRTLRSGDAPFDRFERGDTKAISESAARGWEIFRSKAGCAACHAPPFFTDFGFHAVGIGHGAKEPDLGRGAITKEESDNGRFKTPTLRSVGQHPPYFHDGSGKTLEDAVDYMLSGGPEGAKLDGAFKKVVLTKDERADLLAFVRSLEGPRPKFERPKLP
ncbi:MAG: c-type cytochrome [Deltaproteobacteria bacterium]|nr:c-type cytochrome [Deltaproteobacteria bacterium]